jgi:hypothetical protein
MRHLEDSSATWGRAVEPSRGSAIQISAPIYRQSGVGSTPVAATGEVVQHGVSLSVSYTAQQQSNRKDGCAEHPARLRVCFHNSLLGVVASNLVSVLDKFQVQPRRILAIISK